MFFTKIFVMGLLAIGAMAYLPSGKEHYLTDAILRDLMDRMSLDLSDLSDSYMGYPGLIREQKNQEIFPGIFENDDFIPEKTSIRDREFLEHSSLFGSQYMSGGAGEGPQKLGPQGSMFNKQEIKSDANLPAYCNPPNPCPIGFTEEQGCTLDFENTAAFSRHYQAQQDCMCDSEHMFDCQQNPALSSRNEELRSDFEFGKFLQAIKASNNPFLYGEKLPVAAKKGINVIY